MPENQLLRLVKRARRGDSDAFSELMELKAQDIMFISIKLMGNKADGEDVAQEAIISIGRNIRKLKNPQYFNTWVYRIVLNESMKLKRHRQKEQEELSGAESKISEIAEHNIEVLPEDKMDQSAKRAVVMNALDALPERQRLCLLLFYYEDMTYKEIAKTLQTTEAAVANILLRAKESLRKELEGQDDVLPDDIFADKEASYKLSGASFSGMLALHAEELVDPSVLARIDTTISGLVAAGVIGKASGIGLFAKSVGAVVCCTAVVAATGYGVYYEKHMKNEAIEYEITKSSIEDSLIKKTEAAGVEVLKQPDAGSVVAVIQGDGSAAWQDFQARKNAFTYQGSGTQDGARYDIYSEEAAGEIKYVIVLDQALENSDEEIYLDIVL